MQTDYALRMLIQLGAHSIRLVTIKENAACAAATLLKARGAKDIRFVCLLARRKALRISMRFMAKYQFGQLPSERSRLYIVSGLGDAGDRTFDTK